MNKWTCELRTLYHDEVVETVETLSAKNPPQPYDFIVVQQLNAWGSEEKRFKVDRVCRDYVRKKVIIYVEYCT